MGFPLLLCRDSMSCGALLGGKSHIGAGYYSFIKDYEQKPKKTIFYSMNIPGPFIPMSVDEEGSHLIPNHTPGI